MSVTRVRILLALGAISLLTFLFSKSRTVDPAEHEAFSHNLRQLKEVEAALNEDLLKIGYSVLTFYDPVVAQMAELKTRLKELSRVPDFLGVEAKQELGSFVAEYEKLLAEKEILIQRFKSSNIRLKNSLSYLPILCSDLNRALSGSRRSAEAARLLEHLLKDVLSFALSGEPALVAEIEYRLLRLQEQQAGVERGEDLVLVVAHAKTILASKPRMDRLVARLVSHPTLETVQQIQASYDRFYQARLRRANLYRGALFAFALILLLYIAYMVVRLGRASRELNRAKDRLEQRVRERTSELEQSQIRNQALINAIPDAMLRVSGEGRVLDVEPSLGFGLEFPGKDPAGVHLTALLPELGKELMPHIQRALQTQSSQLVTCRSDSGPRSRDYEARLELCGNDQVLLILRDVSEQKQAADELARAKQRSERLLESILPIDIANELKARGSVEPKYFEDVTLISTTFAGFSASTEELAAEELVFLLHDYFTAFDEITSRYRLEKLKTAGDSYLCVGGLPRRTPSHPVDAVLAALEMVRAVQERDHPDKLVDWTVRVGIHTGPVVAGVVGIRKFAFDVWGQTVDFSARLQAAGEGNKINLSPHTYARVKDFVSCQPRGSIPCQGGGQRVDMYFADGILPDLVDDCERLPPPSFLKRYRIYFQADPPSFPTGLNSSGRLCLPSRSGKVRSNLLARGQHRMRLPP